MMTAKQLDPKVEAVFEAMIAFLGDDYKSAYSNANYDGAALTLGLTAEDFQGQSFTFSTRTPGTRIAISPLGASLGPGEQQQFSATASNPDGSPIAGAAFEWSLAAGNPGSITPAGLYTAPAAIAAAGLANVTAKLTGGQAWATVAVNLHP